MIITTIKLSQEINIMGRPTWVGFDGTITEGEDEIKGLEPEVSVWEPRLALSGGADGYQFYRRIVSQAQSHLASDGVLMLEAGDGQAQTLRELLENAGYARIEEIRDLTGTVRGLAAFLV